MKLFLTSVRTCVDQIPEFKNLIKQDTKLVILPFSYHKDYINCAEDIYNHFDRDPSNKESIFYETVRPFVDAGIPLENIAVMNQFVDSPSYINFRITRPNVIVYLPGGFPENIVENIYKYKLDKCIKCCPVIVGESAGSMAPFSRFFVYKDQDYSGYKHYHGLNMEHFMTFIPHFTPDNKDVTKACYKFSKRFPYIDIYCVMDGGYLIIDNHKLIKAHKAYKWVRKPFSRKFHLIKPRI